jgi:hypothetical protein
VPHLKARLLAGPEVRLVDISRRGILLETESRLLPGSPIRVKFVANDATLVMKGSVIRSNVTIVSGEGVMYRTAVAFDEDISLCDERLWQEDPSPAEDPPTPLSIVPAEANATADAEAGHAPPGPAGPQPTARTATVTTLFAASSDDLRALLAANDW